MGTRVAMAGMEVPLVGTDSVRWFQVAVPSPSISLEQQLQQQTFAAPPTMDAASSFSFGNPPIHLIWRIHKSRPNALEIVELCGYKDVSRTGLQIEFADALCPYVFIWKNETPFVSGNPYMLYALTVTGVAYLIRLKDFHDYASWSIFPQDEILEYNILSNIHYGAITAVAATAGCLVIGGNDGSVHCVQLGILDPSDLGFLHELRDDAGFGRLWGLMSRSRTVAAVQGLSVLEVHGKKILVVLHSDGMFRVWDLLSCSKIFSHTMNSPTSTGNIFMKLWAGQAVNDTCTIPLAFLHKASSEADAETISIYNLHFSLRDKMVFSLEPLTQNISLDEGGLIDIQFSSKEVWILKGDGLVMQKLCGPDASGEVSQCFALQEAFVAEQLFQSLEHSSDDLLWLAHSVYASLKEKIAPFVSSIFLRRLLLPGVHHIAAFRATLQDYNKHLTDSDLYSLTADGMKKEILSIIEHEGVSRSPLSAFFSWKTFCTRYFDNWCRDNAPVGLLIDSSTGAIGLIRKTSLSLFRSLEDIELLAFGSFEEIGKIVSSGMNFSGDGLEHEILFEVLRCINNVNQQLGKAASALFYESFFATSNVSSEEVVPRLLKILETGYTPSIAALHISELGTNTAWEKEVADHKSVRKFSTEMFLSLNGLHSKATSWNKVLDIIESYLKYLVPPKTEQNLGSDAVFNMGTSATIQATSQVAKMMFESALDMLLLLNYIVKISGQIHMLPYDVSRVQLELVPMIQEVITEWHIIHFLGTSPSESPTVEDFSYQLSSLQIDGSSNKRSWNDKLGKCDFTLAFTLQLNMQTSSNDLTHLRCIPDPSSFISSVRNFTSWLIWGKSGEESFSFFSHSTELALILLRNGQYGAAEYLLTLVDAHLRKEKTSESIQGMNNEWCTVLHLLGCCLLAQANCGSPKKVTKEKVCEAICCFFRAVSVQGSPQALQSLPNEAGLPYLGFTGIITKAAWKLHYYEWTMEIFERFNLSEGACRFALAALEQVDALERNEESDGPDSLTESATTLKGRLWANVFKFTLDMNNYFEAYCAIISNPDQESKYICLRRFIIVLYERGAVKILCDGQLPFIDLSEHVERELVWKAERSDVSANPNPYKLLYALEMHQRNWRKAARYIYLYSAQLKAELAFKDQQPSALALQERLNCLSAAVNALHLVHPAYAWIDPLLEEKSLQKEAYPSKKARISVQEQPDDSETQRLPSCLDIEELENEFVLASTEYLLCIANVKWKFAGVEKSHLVDLLVQSNLFDMAFTLLLKFWKGSALKRELERVFVVMSLNCCPSRGHSLFAGRSNFFGTHWRKILGPPLVKTHGLLLTSSKDEVVVHGSHHVVPSVQQSKGNIQWETLEIYIEKYKCFHPRLPVVVAETLLSTDAQIELPLWLVQMFKTVRREGSWGMAGDESSAASLLQLYVDYGRYAEATNLLNEYMESFASMRPADLIRRKKSSAAWFPYTTVERLWYKLEESINSGHMIDHCGKLKSLLHGSLQKHLNLLKMDSDDVQSGNV